MSETPASTVKSSGSLIDLARAGDAAALSELKLHWCGRLAAIIGTMDRLGRIPRRVGTDDLLNETFWRVISPRFLAKAADSDRATRRKLYEGAVIFSIKELGYRQSFTRGESLDVDRHDPADPWTPAKASMLAENYSIIEGILSARERLVLEELARGGTVREVAAILDKSRIAAQSVVQRLRNKLRRSWQGKTDE